MGQIIPPPLAAFSDTNCLPLCPRPFISRWGRMNGIYRIRRNQHRKKKQKNVSNYFQKCHHFPHGRSPGTYCTIYILHTYCKKKCVQLFSKMSPFPLGYGSPGDLHSVRKNVSNYFQRCHHFPHGIRHQGPTIYIVYWKKKCVQLFSEMSPFPPRFRSPGTYML